MNPFADAPPYIEQAWIGEWQRGSWSADPDMWADFPPWFSRLPESVKRLARRFPPGCLVRARVPLMIPAMGTVGIVISYNEPDPKSPEGYVNVVQDPLAEVRATCLPGQLEVIGYRRGFDRAALLILEGAGSAAGKPS